MSPRFPLRFALILTVFGSAFSQLNCADAAPVSTPPTASSRDVFRVYHNARYGTTTIYPANLVAPQSEAENGDGRKFVSRDGKIQLAVFGAHNIFDRTARAQMTSAITDWRRDGARVTYSRFSSSGFAVSGYLGAEIFYQKTLLRDGTFHTLIWRYPQTLKTRLDASVTRSVATFRVGASLEKPVATPRANAKPKRTIAPTGGY